MDEAVIFKALADSTRRLILQELAERKDQTLFELCGRLIMIHKVSMSRQAITKHLDVLEKSGLVHSVARGKYRVLNFDKEPIEYITMRWLE